MSAQRFWIAERDWAELRQLYPKTWPDLKAKCVDGGLYDGERIPAGVASVVTSGLKPTESHYLFDPSGYGGPRWTGPVWRWVAL